MRKSLLLFGCATLALAGCGQEEDRAASDASYTSVEADMAEQAAEPMAERVAPAPPANIAATGVQGSSIPELAEIPVTLPQLAYTYDYRWKMPAAEIGGLQRRHASLCEQQGPGNCQILGMSKTGEEAGEVEAVLEMAVASRGARAFGALMEDEAIDAGAQQISAEIASEELSKQIVDTEASLRARTELRDRLLEVLRTRKGSVQELVDAERSVARVNEEIDQARSWLKQMEGRVAYSRVTVRYETGVPVSSDFLGPVEGALGALGSIFGYIVALLILLGAVALPIGLAVWGIRTVTRKTAAMSEGAA